MLFTIPVTMLRAANNSVTISIVELLALTKVSSDPKFSDKANWEKVTACWKSTTGGQREYISYDFAGSTDAKNFYVSDNSRIDFVLSYVAIMNIDKETLIVTRADIPSVGLYDFSFYIAPPGSSFSPTLKYAGITLSNSDLTATYSGISSFTWAEMADYIVVSSAGKYYLEFTAGLVSNPGSIIGVSFASADPTQFLNTPIGFATSAFGGEGGGSGGIVTYNHTPTIYIGGATTANSTGGVGPTWTTGDTLMMAIDVANKKVWFGKNGTWAASGNPETNTNGTSFNTELGASTRIYPHAGGKIAGDNVTKVSSPVYTPVGFTNF